MKKCTRCGQTKPLTDFYKNRARHDGVTVYCKPCQYEYLRARPNREAYAREYMRKWNAENRDRKNELRRGKRQKEVMAVRERRAVDPVFAEQQRIAVRKWSTANKEKTYARTARRRVAKLQRTVVWDSEFTALVTAEAHNVRRRRDTATGLKWHVDHIIPLRGKTVSGLHTWNNLQVIPAILNQRKKDFYKDALT